MRARATSRISTVLTLAAAVWLALAEPALACPVCFGAADAPPVSGMRMAIFALLGVTAVVLGAFAGFFIYLMRRARMSAATSTVETTVGGAPASAYGRSW